MYSKCTFIIHHINEPYFLHDDEQALFILSLSHIHRPAAVYTHQKCVNRGCIKYSLQTPWFRISHKNRLYKGKGHSWLFSNFTSLLPSLKIQRVAELEVQQSAVWPVHRTTTRGPQWTSVVSQESHNEASDNINSQPTLPYKKYFILTIKLQFLQ